MSSRLPDHIGELAEDKPDLRDAIDTDEIYTLAYQLAAWGLRAGECDEYNAVDWVLGQPHEAKLPRGSRGTLNPTAHHVTKGASRAVEQYVPGVRPDFDPEPVHALAARIEGSGVTHERYLLAVVSLCFEYQTLTPVVTGPLLARLAGVSEPVAGKVLAKWGTTLAYGFFTGVSYDGVVGHGRVWTVDPGWVPTSKPKHEPGCPRGKRCRCRVSQSGLSIFSAEKDRSPKVRQFDAWVASLGSDSRVTVTDTCKATGMTRAEATRQLQAAEGSALKTGTFSGGRVRRRSASGTWYWTQQPETWFTA